MTWRGGLSAIKLMFRAGRADKKDVMFYSAGATIATSPGTPAVGEANGRRSEPRFPAQGRIRISYGNPEATVNAFLLETSGRGMRVWHKNVQLPTGAIVSFANPTEEGTARVIWSRARKDRMEAGLLILR